MADANKLALIKELLDSAESNIHSAKQLLAETTGVPLVDNAKYSDKAAKVGGVYEGGKVIEGVFDGQNMIDKDDNSYPVPANYASKSKLVPGDILKLTITDEGRFIYKQIGPVERKTIMGPLVQENGQYRVLANGKAYKVLLASVTYFRASVGDKISLIVPDGEDSEWGAIEAVIPQVSSDEQLAEEHMNQADDLDDDELGL